MDTPPPAARDGSSPPGPMVDAGPDAAAHAIVGAAPEAPLDAAHPAVGAPDVAPGEIAHLEALRAALGIASSHASVSGPATAAALGHASVSGPATASGPATGAHASALDAVLAAVTAGSVREAPPPDWRRKTAYHHGDLHASALARGREIVALCGPTGLTLRGLARDLGVTAAALAHVFGCVAHLREAVARSILEELGKASGTRPERRPTPQDVAAPWIAYAAANANLYRMACGEGWAEQPVRPTGRLGTFATPSPRRLLESALWPRTRRLGKPKGDPVSARRYAFAIHGLALARIDGVPEEEVVRELERLLA